MSNILRDQLNEAYEAQQKAFSGFINGLDTEKLDQGEMARLVQFIKANSSMIAVFEMAKADNFRAVSYQNDWGWLGGETEVPDGTPKA